MPLTFGKPVTAELGDDGYVTFNFPGPTHYTHFWATRLSGDHLSVSALGDGGWFETGFTLSSNRPVLLSGLGPIRAIRLEAPAEATEASVVLRPVAGNDLSGDLSIEAAPFVFCTGYETPGEGATASNAPIPPGTVLHLTFDRLPAPDGVRIRVIEGESGEEGVNADASVIVGHAFTDGQATLMHHGVMITSDDAGFYYPGQPRELFVWNTGDDPAVVVISASLTSTKTSGLPPQTGANGFDGADSVQSVEWLEVED